MINKHKEKIIAIIATCNREELLLNRSVLSISRQLLFPDCIVIVNDSTTKIDEVTINSLNMLFDNKVKLVFLENCRTKGASGAWNTGIIYAGLNYSIDSSFIAILDDDDKWDSTHLLSCSSYMNSSEMIISGIKRKEHNNYTLSSIPHSLNQSDFLVGNPGIQGSNIFIRLCKMFEVGMFDENLTASTDRDLCIRLCEINIKVTSTKSYTVIHYADNDRLRLSTPSQKKSDSLSIFWNKYKTRMTKEEKRIFKKRAFDLFNFIPIENKNIKKNIPLEIKACEPFPLVIGIISGSSKQLKPLLMDLKKVSDIDCIQYIEVIIMHNGGSESELRDLVLLMRNEKLSCLFIDENQKILNLKELCCGYDFYKNKLPIGKARSILQKYIGTYVENINNCIVWLLDDDMRLESKVKQYLSWLPEFRKDGIDVLIGSYEGASPNPATNAVRVQLNDLLHNLKWLNNMDENDVLPDKEYENKLLRDKYNDYYYDLSRKHFGHLESPFWITKEKNNETVKEVKNRLINSVHKIFTGEPLFRPLKVELPNDPISEAKDSANRGGTTFILNTEVLKQTPNTIIEIKDNESRRSDMIWAIINKYYYGRNIKFVNFSIYHDRNINLINKLDLEKTMGEIRGSAIYAALFEILSKKGNSDFNFSSDEINLMINKVSNYLENRLELYKQNFFRIRGLSKALEEFNTNNELTCFLNYINEWFSTNNLNKFKSIAREMNSVELEVFFKSLKKQVEEYSKVKVNIDFLEEQSFYRIDS